MRIDFHGRQDEIKLLEKHYASPRSELAAVYGRRRVGKSTLVQLFAKAHPNLLFEGLENKDTKSQINHFTQVLKQQIPDTLLQKAHFESWSEVFDYLATYFEKQKSKIVVFFDEFQWMAAGQSQLISLIKYYWDNKWKSQNVMLILCGSIASFMVRKVIRSKALYGRLTLQMNIKKLLPHDAFLFLKKKSQIEQLKFLLVLGGVPKYLQDIDLKSSFEQNIETLFFKKDALYIDEFEKIFHVHFKKPNNYLKIIKSLDQKKLNLNEISIALKMKSSGGVKNYIENLELAEFISPNYNYQNIQSRFIKYKISDEFLYFYTKFVYPHLKIIKSGAGLSLFRTKIQKQMVPWFGFSFENFFINNAIYFSEKMGFKDKVQSFGPLFDKEAGFQFDLIYSRSDSTLSICELKFYQEKISTKVISDFESKLKKANFNKKFNLHKILVAPLGATEELIDSNYFDIIFTAEDILA